MSSLQSRPSPAFDAYEALADTYDLFTAGYNYDRLVGVLDALVQAHRAPGRKMLDLGCGTGHALERFAALGYSVTGSDLSPGMVERAQRRVPTADLVVADMRDELSGGPFDIVVCLDDTLNYLLDDGDLELVMRNIAGALAPGGLLVFDVNLPLAYHGQFSRDIVVGDADHLLAWRGHGLDELSALATATIEVVEASGPAHAARWTKSHHVQRYWPLDAVQRAVHAHGLELVEIYGQRTGATLEAPVDLGRDGKALHLARRPSSSPAERRPR